MVFLTTSRPIWAGLFLCLVSLTTSFGQNSGNPRNAPKSQLALWSGDHEKAIVLSDYDIARHKTSGEVNHVYLNYETKARALTALGNYSESDATLNQAIEYLNSKSGARRLFVLAHLAFADLRRSERKTAQAFEHLDKALQFDPMDSQVRAEYNLGVGRMLFRLGYDASAIIWLEKAEQLFERQAVTEGKVDTYRFLALAWSAKLNFSKSVEYSQLLVNSTEGTVFSGKFRQALFDHASTLSASGQKSQAHSTFEKGLRVSLNDGSGFRARKFVARLLLNSLYDNNLEKAREYLSQLTRLDSDESYLFERLLGKAVIHALLGEKDASNAIFKNLEKIAPPTKYLIPSWKIIIAERAQDWDQVIRLNHGLLELTLKENFRDDLPRIYFSIAQAKFHVNQRNEALEFLEKSISLVEEIRNSESKSLSLGLLDTFHRAYRLLAQIHFDNPGRALHLIDYLKARILRDRINNAPTRIHPGIMIESRQRLTALSTEFIRNPGIEAELEKLERSITIARPQLNIAKSEISELGEVTELENTAVVSYFFTIDKKLLVFVWEKAKPVRSVELPVNEDDIATETEELHKKIKNRVFFKRDGKALFDKLLKPLNLNVKQLILIPDKHLWKVPFQALSPDGEKYLIENRVITYAPSIAVLQEHLKQPKPQRRSLQAFSNASFGKVTLKFVDTEASGIARLYGSQPILNATTADMERFADKADILHFSMHAQVDNDQPLESFLGFRRGVGLSNGRLSVENLLDIKLRKGCLVFVASCDTNNVVSGEGLVSIAWGMMGSGASTVISAQWEANDRSTEIFTGHFYESYRQGFSSSEAMQKAAVQMIKDKSANFHEPYYWAAFTLNGDFR